ncbi:RNA polymerase, sigma-24 subunit, ECF subfamily [Granulicella mallensis MP5ACTX8]|uniref:RNA polymerase, sigma-24 subunit, ECF subfamily n=2 Tax=Granulicella mallensis TaxID=940614 RepID=G8NXH2_GRAMM|nr:RNA polymerase, sigma-24 subunit, ECF subfamily [Granulicella mallensis MP5ACTX8]
MQPKTMTVPQESREAAFARIVAEHARFLYRVAYSLLRHPQDAEDAVQDALLKLYRGESWRGMEDERAFLARVVWRSALDRVRMRSVGVEDEDAELRLQDVRPSPESAAAESDEHALLHELIEDLPLELREPLLLTAMEELSSKEVGLMLGLPEGTVRTRLMRARAALREQFRERFEERSQAVAGTRRR